MSGGLKLGKETIYFAPDAVLIMAGNSVAALRYDDIEINAHSRNFIENEGAPKDARVIGETWQYVNKTGGPDRRFVNNQKLPVCLYAEIDLRSTSGLNERIQCSCVEPAT